MGKLYTYENQLKEKSEEFISKLCEENIFADILEDSLREYSIKISANDYGIINLYYKPTQDSYSISLHEIKKKEKCVLINKLWDETDGMKKKETYKNIGYEIDVDGSYQNGITSYGAVIRKDGEIIKELSGILSIFEVQGSHQVAGEIKAVTESVNWCRKNELKEVTIYYDYKGLEKWASGHWKTKKQISKDYADFMSENGIKIYWVKIKSHTGKKWNEYADKLASDAITDYLKDDN